MGRTFRKEQEDEQMPSHYIDPNWMAKFRRQDRERRTLRKLTRDVTCHDVNESDSE